MTWTIRARPDLDAYIRERQSSNLSATLMTVEFVRQIVEHHAHQRKVLRVLEYLGVLNKGLEKLGVEWKRIYKRQLKFQPLFSTDAGDSILDDWFVARFEHTLFNKRGGIVFERARDKAVVNAFGSLDDALRFENDPDAVFAEIIRRG